MIAIEELGFDYKDIKNIIINGYKSAFVHYKERVNLLNSALKEMKELEEKNMQESAEVDSVI
jgi:adenosine deaminase